MEFRLVFDLNIDVIVKSQFAYSHDYWHIPGYRIIYISHENLIKSK